MKPPTSIEQVLEYYREQLVAEQAISARVSSRWSSVGYLRGGLFLGFLATLLMGFANVSGMALVWWIIAALLLVSFIVVAIIHEGMQTVLHRSKILANMHRESIARCNRDWTEITVPPVEVPAAFVPVSTDLDLLGASSVYKLLGVTRTPLGTETLRQWIIEGANPDEIKQRQEAVTELKPEFEWRLKFRLLCEYLGASQSGPSRFVDWCESPNWFNGREWVLWLTRLVSVVSVLTIILFVCGFLPLAVAAITIVAVCVINFVLSIIYAGPIHDVFNQVASRTDQASHYVTLFDMASEFPAKSSKLQKLQIRLKRTGDGAQSNVQRLGLITWLANMRNGMGFIPYIILEFLFFWDAHVLSLMENWKQKNGMRARAWFADLGEWEAIAAMAKLAGDQPDWIFPTVEFSQSNDSALIAGTQVGHPLLDSNRVPNDVQIGPAGTVLLVTGSNMSGKSTLLRSVGVNIVLAQMGSVVCAEKLSLPPMHIETSMRIADSLADGVSFFMAELKRLKAIVDTAKQHDGDATKGENPKRMLFLLDEILQGTNSRERQIAVSRVVRKLIDESAIGAISTHDLDLATTDELAKACQTVHFAEQFHEVDGKKVMTFDYAMRSGIAETTNALKLLEMVGLGEKD
jgi:ABC-type multidrug transport system fused ATPase/permease subunit